VRSTLAAARVLLASSSTLIVSPGTPKLSVGRELGAPSQSLDPVTSRTKLGSSGGGWILNRSPRGSRWCGEVVRPSMVGICREVGRSHPWLEALWPLVCGEPGAARVVARARAAGRGARLTTLARLDTWLVTCVAGLPTSKTTQASPQTLPLAQSLVNLWEGWSTSWHLVPALDHERVHPTRTILRTGQQLTRSDHLDHL